jgi:hypothetical protein
LGLFIEPPRRQDHNEQMLLNINDEAWHSWRLGGLELIDQTFLNPLFRENWKYNPLRPNYNDLKNIFMKSALLNRFIPNDLKRIDHLKYINSSNLE